MGPDGLTLPRSSATKQQGQQQQQHTQLIVSLLFWPSELNFLLLLLLSKYEPYAFIKLKINK
jgi:hypothetical protein